MADDDCIRTIGYRICSITGTDNHSVLLSIQGMVVANDNIGLIGLFDWFNTVVIIAVTGKRIVSTDDVVMFAIDDFIVEAIDVIVL